MNNVEKRLDHCKSVVLDVERRDNHNDQIWWNGRIKTIPTSDAPRTPWRMNPIHMASCAARGPGIICANAKPSLYSSDVIQPRGTRSRCMYPASAIGPPNPNDPRPRK